jgi:hypothetical protein
MRVRLRLCLRDDILPPPPIGFIVFVASPIILFDGLFKLFIILFILLESDGSFNAEIQVKGGLIGSNASKSLSIFHPPGQIGSPPSGFVVGFGLPFSSSTLLLSVSLFLLDVTIYSNIYYIIVILNIHSPCIKSVPHFSVSRFINVSSQRYSHGHGHGYYLICDRNGLTSPAALKVAAAAARASASATLRFAAAAGCGGAT